MTNIDFKRITEDRLTAEINGHSLEIEGLSEKIVAVVISANKVPWDDLKKVIEVFEREKNIILNVEKGNITTISAEMFAEPEIIETQTPSNLQKVTLSEKKE